MFLCFLVSYCSSVLMNKVAGSFMVFLMLRSIPFGRFTCLVHFSVCLLCVFCQYTDHVRDNFAVFSFKVDRRHEMSSAGF